MPGDHLKPQTRQFVAKLLEYFQLEKDNGGPLISVNCVHERVAEAFGISLRTVSSINQQSKNQENIPIQKCIKRSKPKTLDLDEPVKMEVRNTLYDMYKENKQVTLTSLANELKAKHILQISTTALHSLLLHLEFKCKKDNNRRALMERSNIAAKRHSFLRKYYENQSSPHSRSVIFLDETWIFAKGSAKRSWQDNNVKSVRKPEGHEGKRFIVLHAGGKDGFVPNCSLLFASKSKMLDYHGEMNSEIFIKWVREKLIINLEEPSLIIMDNAPYHSVQSEKQPSSAWKKKNIMDWLTQKHIDYEPTMSKIELLAVAKCHRVETTYVVDELLREYGHEVLRLPPYHCQFNAIELVWARAKSYYNQYVGKDGYRDDAVLQLWEEALNQCTSEFWSSCVRHTEDIIKEWYDREKILEDIPAVIINLNDDSSSESENVGENID